MSKLITISEQAAQKIDRAFLPTNPNKLRKPHITPDELAALRGAVVEFRKALAGQPNPEMQRLQRFEKETCHALTVFADTNDAAQLIARLQVIAGFEDGDEDGTSGQDRECYSDDQDRDSYSA